MKFVVHGYRREESQYTVTGARSSQYTVTVARSSKYTVAGARSSQYTVADARNSQYTIFGAKVYNMLGLWPFYYLCLKPSVLFL